MPSSPGTAHSRLVYGVDFSAAAADAGTKTWIASGVAENDNRLIIVDVAPLVEFLDLDAAARESCLSALATWIRGLGDDAVVGLDFPFGLPAFMLQELGCDSWQSFISDFPDAVLNNGGTDGNADNDTNDPVRVFARRCVGLTEEYGEGTYDKRETDAAVGARSPYGFIADTIAFYGMRDVLAEIVDDVRVMPMDLGREDAPNGPTVVETYPAAVFDRRELCRTKYKGSSDAERTRRQRNAEGLTGPQISYQSDLDIVATLVDDANGDALDAVAACVGAHGALRNDFEIGGDVDSDAVGREGYIYA